MIKKFYDENNYIIGIVIGDTSDKNVETNIDNAIRIAHLLSAIPQRKGYSAHLLEYGNGEYVNYDYVYEKIPESEWPDELIKEIFKDQIMDSITINSRPATKEGYILKPVLNGTNITWEFVKDTVPSEDEDITKGSYINPIVYEPGMEVKITKWYTDGSDVWEAIKTGTPVDFTDREYFDIIG